MQTYVVAAAAVVALVACNPRQSDESVKPAKTPLPTRQTTIDPVKKKLDAAADDIERRRKDIDTAAK